METKYHRSDKSLYVDLSLSIITFILLIFFLLDGDYFLIDMIHSYAVHGIFLFLMIMAAALFYRKYFTSVISFAGSLLLLFTHAGMLFETQPVVKVEEELRLAHFNVYMYNKGYDSIINAAANSGADLISFQEVDDAWGSRLTYRLAEDYPHYKIVPRNDCYGLAVFSKYPFKELNVQYWQKLPAITGTMESPHGNINFVAMHTKAPITPTRYSIRNGQLAELKDYLKKVRSPKVVLGDFNIVPWASEIREVVTTNDMLTSRKGFMPTYPARFAIVQIPIDYILHCRELECLNFSLIEDVSSDHLGIMGSYRLKKDKLVEK